MKYKEERIGKIVTVKEKSRNREGNFDDNERGRMRKK